MRGGNDRHDFTDVELIKFLGSDNLKKFFEYDGTDPKNFMFTCDNEKGDTKCPTGSEGRDIQYQYFQFVATFMRALNYIENPDPSKVKNYDKDEPGVIAIFKSATDDKSPYVHQNVASTITQFLYQDSPKVKFLIPGLNYLDGQFPLFKVDKTLRQPLYPLFQYLSCFVSLLDLSLSPRGRDVVSYLYTGSDPQFHELLNRVYNQFVAINVRIKEPEFKDDTLTRLLLSALSSATSGIIDDCLESDKDVETAGLWSDGLKIALEAANWRIDQDTFAAAVDTFFKVRKTELENNRTAITTSVATANVGEAESKAYLLALCNFVIDDCDLLLADCAKPLTRYVYLLDASRAVFANLLHFRIAYARNIAGAAGNRANPDTLINYTTKAAFVANTFVNPLVPPLDSRPVLVALHNAGLAANMPAVGAPYVSVTGTALGVLNPPDVNASAICAAYDAYNSCSVIPQNAILVANYPINNAMIPLAVAAVATNWTNVTHPVRAVVGVTGATQQLAVTNALANPDVAQKKLAIETAVATIGTITNNLGGIQCLIYQICLLVDNGHADDDVILVGYIANEAARVFSINNIKKYGNTPTLKGATGPATEDLARNVAEFFNYRYKDDPALNQDQFFMKDQDKMIFKEFLSGGKNRNAFGGASRKIQTLQTIISRHAKSGEYATAVSRFVGALDSVREEFNVTAGGTTVVIPARANPKENAHMGIRIILFTILQYALDNCPATSLCPFSLDLTANAKKGAVITLIEKNLKAYDFVVRRLRSTPQIGQLPTVYQEAFVDGFLLHDMAPNLSNAQKKSLKSLGSTFDWLIEDKPERESLRKKLSDVLEIIKYDGTSKTGAVVDLSADLSSLKTLDRKTSRFNVRKKVEGTYLYNLVGGARVPLRGQDPLFLAFIPVFDNRYIRSVWISPTASIKASELQVANDEQVVRRLFKAIYESPDDEVKIDFIGARVIPIPTTQFMGAIVQSPDAIAKATDLQKVLANYAAFPIKDFALTGADDEELRDLIERQSKVPQWWAKVNSQDGTLTYVEYDKDGKEVEQKDARADDRQCRFTNLKGSDCFQYIQKCALGEGSVEDTCNALFKEDTYNKSVLKVTDTPSKTAIAVAVQDVNPRVAMQLLDKFKFERVTLQPASDKSGLNTWGYQGVTSWLHRIQRTQAFPQETLDKIKGSESLKLYLQVFVNWANVNLQLNNPERTGLTFPKNPNSVPKTAFTVVPRAIGPDIARRLGELRTDLERARASVVSGQVNIYDPVSLMSRVNIPTLVQPLSNNALLPGVLVPGSPSFFQAPPRLYKQTGGTRGGFTGPTPDDAIFSLDSHNLSANYYRQQFRYLNDLGQQMKKAVDVRGQPQQRGIELAQSSADAIEKAITKLNDTEREIKRELLNQQKKAQLRTLSRGQVDADLIIKPDGSNTTAVLDQLVPKYRNLTRLTNSYNKQTINMFEVLLAVAKTYSDYANGM